jgi:LPXTG-motif cell wall-anchored protein
MKKTMLFLAVFGLGLATMISAQLPTSQQSNAPTSNSFQMRIVEPLEGATIQGTDFNIVLGQPVVPPAGTSVVPAERKDSLTPTYQVWVDGKDYGNVPIGQNVFKITSVSYGPHKIVIAAKNTAGELIDRKELSVTTIAAQVAETRSMQTKITTETAPAPAYVPPPAPASAPAPQPQYTTESPTLPKTATSYPLAALAGASLIAAGALLRRRLS